MQVESILSLGDSDGHIEILDGGGMCPGGRSFFVSHSRLAQFFTENMRGCGVYNKFLKEYDQVPLSKKCVTLKHILRC
jgi:hypothetical protein